MNQPARPKMFTEACETKKGLNWIVEILVFFAVFSAATMVESIPVTVATLVHIFTNSTFLADVQAALANLDTAAFNDAVYAVIDTIPSWLNLLSLYCTVLLTGMVLAFCRVLQKRKPASLGMRKGNIAKEYILGGIFGIVMLLVAVAFGLASHSMTISLSENFSWIIILYFFGYVLQGMSEEILCRGYFMVSYSRRHNMAIAVILNSLIFGLLHFSNPGFDLHAFINLTLSGVVFSLYVIKRGNIWGACAMHSMWNFVQGNILGFNVSGTTLEPSVFRVTQVSGHSLFNGGTFGIEGGLCDTFVEILAIIAILAFIPKKEDEY